MRKKIKKIKPKPIKPASGQVAIVALDRHTKARIRVFPARKRSVLARGPTDFDIDDRPRVTDSLVRVAAPNMIFVELIGNSSGFKVLFVGRSDTLPPKDLSGLMMHPVRPFHLPNTGDETSVADVCLGDAENKVRGGFLDPVDAFWNTRFQTTPPGLREAFKRKSEARTLIEWLISIGVENPF